MILINFLPKELQPRVVRQIKLPIVPVMVFVFVIFLLVALYNLLVFSRIGMERRRLEDEWQKLKTPTEDAEKLQREISSGIATEANFFRTSLFTPIEMAQLLNIVSDHLPKNVWLSDLDCEKRRDGIRLVVSGYSETASNDTKLVEIQNYSSLIKDQVETLLVPFVGMEETKAASTDKEKNQKSASASTNKKPKMTSSVTTSSKAGAGQEGELTQFVITIQTEGFQK